MKALRKKGELTRFQILSEIAMRQPYVRQKDIADKLGVTVQAVSENIKSLIAEGLVESGSGRSHYKITRRGAEKIKEAAMDLRRYADEVLESMSFYRSVWPAIAWEDLQEGDKVELFMEDGILYARRRRNGEAYAEVLHPARRGEDVALSELGGTIPLQRGKVTIAVLPGISEGGSRNADLERLRELSRGHDRTGIMGTVSRAAANKLNMQVDFEFATPHAALAAAKRGLNVLVLAVGKMSRSITEKLEKEGIEYSVEDLRLTPKE